MFWLILVIFLLVGLMYTMWRMRDHELLRKYWIYNHTSTTLFEKYGGLQTIQKVVDDAVAALVAEPTLANVFAVVGQPGHRSGPQLKSILDAQFSNLFGFYNAYPGKTFTRGFCIDGRTMKASHMGLNITTAQFNTFVGILVATLLADGVTQADVNALAPALNAMAADIVEVV